VIATKELILCFSGSIFRLSAKAFGIGDWIEIDGIRGEVLSQNLFSTTVHQVGPRESSHQNTGRAVIIPNSLFLSHPITNESWEGDFIRHEVLVTLSRDEEWQRARSCLFEVAEQEVQSFAASVRDYLQRIRDQVETTLVSAQPFVALSLEEKDAIVLTLSMLVPIRQLAQIEQGILTKFMNEFYPKGTDPNGSGTGQES